MKRQKRKFRIHQNLLLDVIQRQAGTLGKAMYEGVMNSVDGGAKCCQVELSATKLSLVDDGRGMTEREIDEQWEIFGNERDEERQKDKQFGYFGMGRGQLLASGKNKWRTGKFLMESDIQDRGTDWDLFTLGKSVKGCRIEIQLYQQLGLVEQDEIKREFTKLIKWIGMHGVEVKFNGDVVSQDPREKPKGFWTHETDKLWLRITNSGSGMAIYHLGGHIKDYSGWEFGVSGELVSKVPIKVNFARNDVMSDCPVWREAKKLVSRKAGEVLVKKKSLDDDGRLCLARQLKFGEVTHDLLSARIFTAVTGRHYSLKQLRRQWGYNHYSSAEQGSRLGDKIHKSKIAFVFGQDTLDRFDEPDILTLMRKVRRWDKAQGTSLYNWDYRPMHELEDQFNDSYQLVDEEDYTLAERVAVSIIEDQVYRFRGYFHEKNYRRIVVGIAAADGWTDGSSYIALNRDWLADVDLGTVQGLTDVGLLVIHEYCHTDTDMASHTHSHEFYEVYHNATIDLLSELVHSAVGSLPKLLAREEKKMTRKQMKDQDRVRKLAEATEAIAPE